MDSPIQPPWYVLRVFPRHERTVSLHLASRQVEPFAPMYQSKRRWSDRTKDIELPLFPGYVFCRFEPAQKLSVLSVPGVASMIAFGGTPTPVSEEEIATVRRVIGSGLPYG